MLGPQLAAVQDEGQVSGMLAEAIEHVLEELERQLGICPSRFPWDALQSLSLPMHQYGILEGRECPFLVREKAPIDVPRAR